MFQKAINSTTSTIQASQQPNATHEHEKKRAQRKGKTKRSKPNSKEKKG
jgi:hypothetical protein